METKKRNQNDDCPTMSFQIAPECIRLGLRAGAIVFRNVRVTASSPSQRAEIAKEGALVRARYSGPSAIRGDPAVASFRDILRRVGANPKSGRPSLERLLTFALKRGDLPAINSLVDAYNLVSIHSS